MTDRTTDFGYRKVATGDKTRLVGEVFTSVAGRYDVMNDLMSAGLHRLWKHHFVATSGIRAGHQVLDLAGGTGDIASRLCDRVGANGRIVLGDINAAMLAEGRDRLLDEGHARRASCAQMDAEALPFADDTFDAVTIAFGLRNVTDKARALRSMRAVLKPGGQVLILEFSKLTVPALKPFYDAYSFGVLPALGALVADDADSYRYLAESIRMHPDQETLKGMLDDAGFAATRYRNLAGGLVAIHRGVKP